jgi:hypothetical protein
LHCIDGKKKEVLIDTAHERYGFGDGVSNGAIDGRAVRQRDDDASLMMNAHEKHAHREALSLMM